MFKLSICGLNFNFPNIVYNLFKFIIQSQLLCEVKFYCDTFILRSTYPKMLNKIFKIFRPNICGFVQVFKF